MISFQRGAEQRSESNSAKVLGTLSRRLGQSEAGERLDLRRAMVGREQDPSAIKTVQHAERLRAGTLQRAR